MKNFWFSLNRAIVSGLVLLVMVPVSNAASPQQTTTQTTPQTATPTGGDQPDSSTSQTAVPKQLDSLPDSPGSRREVALDAKSQQSMPQQLQQNGTREPVGTAAAESVETTGVAASNPAGAAIAPAKQRRTRSFLIKVGALVGAGAAVGAVAALASGSPSRPPGSH
jgi:hypothetical protein